MTKEEILEKLREKLNWNMEGRREILLSLEPEVLIEQAKAIHAVQTAYDELYDGGSCDKESLEYLLRFENPLEMVTDRWLEFNHVDQQGNGPGAAEYSGQSRNGHGL